MLKVASLPLATTESMLKETFGQLPTFFLKMLR